MLLGEEGKRNLRRSDTVQFCQPLPQHRASFWPRKIRREVTIRAAFYCHPSFPRVFCLTLPRSTPQVLLAWDLCVRTGLGKPTGQGRQLSPSTLCLWDPIWGSAFRSGASSTRKPLACCWNESRGRPLCWVLEHRFCKDRLREWGPSSQERRRPQWDLVASSSS